MVAPCFRKIGNTSGAEKDSTRIAGKPKVSIMTR